MAGVGVTSVRGTVGGGGWGRSFEGFDELLLPEEWFRVSVRPILGVTDDDCDRPPREVDDEGAGNSLGLRFSGEVLRSCQSCRGSRARFIAAMDPRDGRRACSLGDRAWVGSGLGSMCRGGGGGGCGVVGLGGGAAGLGGSVGNAWGERDDGPELPRGAHSKGASSDRAVAGRTMPRLAVGGDRMMTIWLGGDRSIASGLNKMIQTMDAKGT